MWTDDGRRRQRTALCLVVLALCGAVVGCDAANREGSLETSNLEAALDRIQPRTIRGHLMFLSHDLLRGRDTGDVGYEIAKEYVAGQFARIGLEPIDGSSYLQPFDLLEAGEDRGSYLEVSGLRIDNSDAVFTPDWLGRRPELSGEGVFVGYGLPVGGRDDYGGLDIEGKIVFRLSGAPAGWEPDPERAFFTRLQTEIAHRHGAAAVVEMQAREPTSEAIDAWARRLEPRRPQRALADGTAASLRTEVTLGPAASERLRRAWGIDREEMLRRSEEGAAARSLGPVSLVRDREVNPGRSWNVMGVVAGRDAEVSDEIVLITSHLDHVGIGAPDETGDRIYNGTHDNALGTAKLLAAAEAMVALEPRRSVGFLAVGAEEGGLLGSWHYVRDPVFPIEGTVATINHDGGLEGAATDDVYAFGDELSADLQRTVALATEQAGLFLQRDERPPFGPEQMLLFRSDQYSFMLAGVPAVYLMPGFSIDGDPERGREMWTDYLDNVNHRQRDDYDPAWSLESPANMAALSVRLAWNLANGQKLPRMDPDGLAVQSRRVPEQPYFLGDDVLSRQSVPTNGPGPAASDR